MYGLLIESLAEYLRATYGEDTWDRIRKEANAETPSFSTQGVYPEPLLPRLVTEASKILNIQEKDLMESVGVFFVVFVGRYGYDRVLSVLGRHLRDFLNGLDNLHEYLRFSYPRMRPPSFFCENETRNGLTLHYRTRRRGYLYYTMGQIKAVGHHYYHTPVRIDIVSEEVQLADLHVTFKLHFDNTGFDEENDKIVVLLDEQFLPIQAHVVFEIFPFAIVFDNKLNIRVLGTSLQNVVPQFIGKNLADVFTIVRPLVDLTWVSILTRTNNIFELVTLEPIHPPELGEENVASVRTGLSDEGFGGDQEPLAERTLQLKGQMMMVDDWECIMYLGTPVMSDLDGMLATGLYINDLSMHDFSRDLLLAGTQQSVELKLALDQEQQKTKRLEESMKKLDEEMKRTDELLYQMIPKAVADRLRNGECAVATCEMFDSVTILFSDVVTFTEMCSRITPMEVVTLLNCMYSLFDNLTEKHKIYKVETIGDAYMTVGGAPDRTEQHASLVCDMALDMLQVIGGLRDPSTNDSIRIRVGINSGSVVAGVVGVKMPRYCLFGDAVNTTSRMESSSEPMKIQISEDTRLLLPPNVYFMEARGSVTLKGKGRMKTYWLTGKVDYVPPTHDEGGPMIINQRYTPVIYGDTILKRDSLAYSALSRYSSPPGSRPTTAATKPARVPDTTRLDVTQLREKVKSSLSVSAPSPAPPNVRSLAPTPAPPPAIRSTPAPPASRSVTIPPPPSTRSTTAATAPPPPPNLRSTTDQAPPPNSLPTIQESPSIQQVAKAVVAARTLSAPRGGPVSLPVAVRPSITKEDISSKLTATKGNVVDKALSQALVEKKPMSSSRSVPQVHCSVQCQSSSCRLQ